MLCIGGADVLNDGIRHVLHTHRVVPELIEGTHIHLRCLRLVHALHDVIGVVSALAAEIHGGKAAHRDIDGLLLGSRDRHEAHHLLAAGIGFEPRLGTDPVRALLRDRALRHLVAQAHLELCAVKARLTRDARDVELALLLCRLFPNKCGRGEEEAELLHGRQLLAQLLIRVHGETRCRNGHPAAAHNLCPKIVAHRVCDVIEYLHSAPPNLSHRDWFDQTCVPIITYFK